jgi:hypothetical protein
MGILTTLLVLTTPGLAVVKQVATAREYPPYPDIWEYVSSLPQKPASFWQAPDGDIVVRSVGWLDKGDGKRMRSSSNVGFFSGDQYQEINTAERLKAGFKHLKHTYRGFTLPDGRVLRSKSSMKGGTCVDPFSAYLGVTDKTGEILNEYRVLYLPDEPELIDHSHCDSGDVYHQKVVPLYLQFVPLEDGTFLGFDRNVVLRFRSDLASNSSLFGRKVFILDKDFDVYTHFGRDPKKRTAPLTQDLYYKYLMTIQEKGA